MDNGTPSRDDAPLLASESVAANIRRYIYVHRPGSLGTATSVVANLGTGSGNRMQVASDGLENQSVRLAIDALRRYRSHKMS